MKDTTRKILVYIIAIALLVTSFVLPPTGVIHPSVLMAVALMIGGYEWLFGHSIKEISIDKNGIHIETYGKDN